LKFEKAKTITEKDKELSYMAKAHSKSKII